MVALTGQWLGAVGAAAAAALAGSAALFFVGLRMPGPTSPAAGAGLLAVFVLVALAAPLVRGDDQRHPPDLGGQDVSQAELDRLGLRGADLAGTVLAGARVDGADLPAGTIDLPGSGATGQPAAAPPPHCL